RDHKRRPLIRGNLPNWIKAEQNSCCAAPVRYGQSAPNERRATTRRNSHDDIFFADASKTHGLGSFRWIIFGSFDSLPERLLTSCDDPLDHFRIGLEGGRAFRGVEHSQAATGSCAHIEKSSA